MRKVRQLKFWLKQALWFVPCAYALNFLYAVTSEQTGGTFGDTFGAANALFSGTALLMLVLAVSLQREELQEVKEERNDTRKLLVGQEALNEMQKTALERQIFEQTFGSLLNSALQEKSRLAVRPVIENKQQQSEYFNASLFSARLLKEISLSTDFNDILRRPENDLTNKNYIYVNILTQLVKLADSAPEEVNVDILLKSLFDEECAYCMAWYIARMSITGQECAHFVSVFELFDLINTLSEAHRIGLANVCGDFAKYKQD